MSEWRHLSLGEVCQFNYGKSLPEHVRNPGNIPVYSSSGITGWHNEPLITGPGLVVGRKGTIGKVYRSKTDFFCIDTAYYILPDESKYTLDWLYYALLDLELHNLNEDSAVPGLNRNTAYSQPLLVPSLGEQERIAEVLSSLDDKIDLLHRQNQTLEQLAETLFRQWFVEEADDSWEELSLDQISEYLNGLALQKYPVVAAEKALPVIKIREMNQGITDSTDLCSAYIPEQYIINDGDILFSWSGSLDVVVWTGGKGALNQHLFKVSSRLYPKWLSYFSTRLFLPEFRDIAADKATTMGHIQRKHLTEARLRIPHSSKMKEYDLVIDPLFSKLIHNSLQIKQLEQTRDTLLPKLMSGAVRVNN